MFSRHTFMPASISRDTISSVSLAGPRVQTILVFLIMGLSSLIGSIASVLRWNLNERGFRDRSHSPVTPVPSKAGTNAASAALSSCA